MVKIKITGEQPFQVNARSFAVSPSNETYTLCYSADGRDFTEWNESTPSGNNLVVNSIAKSMYFYLKNNNSEVTVVF